MNNIEKQVKKMKESVSGEGLSAYTQYKDMKQRLEKMGIILEPSGPKIPALGHHRGNAYSDSRLQPKTTKD